MTPPFAFELLISTNGRAGDLSVNDTPVFRNYEGHRIDVRLPMTHWIASGINRLRWDIFTTDEQALAPYARFSAILRATPHGRVDWRDIFEVSAAGPLTNDRPPNADAGPTLLGRVSATTLALEKRTHITSVERQLDLSASMPSWAWTSGRLIDASPSALQSLVRWYQHLHLLLATKNVAEIQALVMEKGRELADAFGFSMNVAEREIGLTQAPFCDDWKLLTPDWAAAKIEKAADGRLARLFHPEDGTIIVYQDHTGLFQSFDFWLRQTCNGWVMTR